MKKKIAVILGLLVANACGTPSYDAYCTTYDWNTYSTSYDVNFMMHLQCLDQVVQDLELRLLALEQGTEDNTDDISCIRSTLCAIKDLLEEYCCDCSNTWLND